VEPQPSRGYGKSKRLAEQVVAQWVQRGVPVVTFRPVTVYGPRNIKLLASSILDVAIERYAGRKVIDVCQQPINMRLLHISDLVEALLYHIDRSASAGQVYNISSGVYPTSREIVSIITDKLGIGMALRETPECGMSYEQREETRARMIEERGLKTDIIFTKQRFRFLNKANKNNDLSIQKLIDSGFTPRMADTRQGISEAIDWYLENGWIV
jgi:nucleoside-diphosphate-sugar epimerase